jgi:CheY-like chemotaxis protein
MTSTRAIRQYERDNSLARCCIVALTGLASATARLEALSSGVSHFMTKPLSFKTLGSLLRKEEEKKALKEEKRATRRESTTAEQQAKTPVHPHSEHDAEPHSQRPSSDIGFEQAGTTERFSGISENESQHTQQESESRAGVDSASSLETSYPKPEVKGGGVQQAHEENRQTREM